MDVTSIVNDYLFGWVLLSVALGVAFPSLAAIAGFSTPILAIMVGSVSLTLSASAFASVDRSALGRVLLGHAAMPAVAFGIARVLGLSPPLAAGFVLLGAVTPELVTPTMTALADGDAALASTALVVIGVGSTVFTPLAVGLLLGSGVRVDGWQIAQSLAVAVVAPMAVAVGARTRWEARVGRYDDYYPTVSALMVILIIGGVTAANASLIRSETDLLVVVGAGALGLNLAGYALGWVGTRSADGPARVAGALSVGMRDFAVAAALVTAAGFPASASLPAVVFGVVEMASSALLARRFAA
ncbi:MULTISPECIES: bile acid:sodium symporter family protein [Halorussus]|uniref:bile acid:sodium symporter family protein n=1 Tax=Halorussus TaxID=1070314 RepID=UPI000E20CC94|nr:MULTISPECIES: bile acid:sodium symporter [Halorussus]NHN58137.1 Na+-dependent transporter [Halorussus sp. JP-T4]